MECLIAQWFLHVVMDPLHILGSRQAEVDSPVIFGRYSIIVQRKFLVNLAFLLFLNLLVKPFYIFGIDAEVQERVGPDEYGIYFALFSLSMLLNIFLDLGINNFNTRNIAQHSHLLEKHLSGILSVKVLLVGLYVAVLLIAALVLGYRDRAVYILLWLALNQSLTAYIQYMRSNLAGLHLFVQDSIISVLDRTILIGIMIYVLWGGYGAGQAVQIEWFVYAQAMAYGLTALVVTLLVLRNAKWNGIRFSWPFAQMIIKRSAPFALLILLMTLYYRSDTIMLERMLPDGRFQAGVYAQGFRFLDAFNMICYLFAGLLLPLFSRMFKEKEDVSDLVWLGFRLMLGGALTIATIATFHGELIMSLRYAEHTNESGPAFTLLMWSFVCMALNYIFGTLLTAKGDLKFLNTVSATGMVVNICLNFLVIPTCGVWGVALTSLITQAVVALTQMTYSLRSTQMRVPPKLLFRTFLFLTGGLLISALLPRTGASDLLFVLTLLAAVGGWAFVSGMIDLRGMTRLILARQTSK